MQSPVIPSTRCLSRFPIGLYVWTFIADIVYLLTDRNPMWYDIAFYTGIAAWVSALVALPGIGDYLTVASKTNASQMALLHGALNVVVAALFIVATILMWDEGATAGTALAIVIILHGVGNGLLAVTGWLGGELSFRHHVGMVPDTSELERAEEAQHTRS